MMNLANKAYMAKNMMRMQKKFPRQYSFFPRTWNLPNDSADFKAGNYSTTFIAEHQDELCAAHPPKKKLSSSNADALAVALAVSVARSEQKKPQSSQESSGLSPWVLAHRGRALG